MDFSQKAKSGASMEWNNTPGNYCSGPQTKMQKNAYALIHYKYSQARIWKQLKCREQMTG